MTLRITTLSGKNEAIIRIEGHFDAAGVTALKQAFQAGGASDLDLSDLQSADAEAIRALRSYADQGVKLVGASPYIHQLLVELEKREAAGD